MSRIHNNSRKQQILLQNSEEKIFRSVDYLSVVVIRGSLVTGQVFPLRAGERTAAPLLLFQLHALRLRKQQLQYYAAIRKKSISECGMVVGRFNPNLTLARCVFNGMRSSRVVRASDSQCRSRNCPGFDPSILRHSGI